MSLRSDNSGLTLTVATHVFLAEPSLSRAVEAQAIARVHRIGQTRSSFVHKFVIPGTIEETIVEMQARDEFALAHARDAKARAEERGGAEDEEEEEGAGGGGGGGGSGMKDSESSSSSVREDPSALARAFVGPTKAVDMTSGSVSVKGKESLSIQQLLDALELANKAG